jgi:hypothetical protein
MSLRRCSECQLVFVGGYRCEHCGELVCDDCAIDHPCNWSVGPDDDINLEEEEEEDD